MCPKQEATSRLNYGAGFMHESTVEHAAILLNALPAIRRRALRHSGEAVKRQIMGVEGTCRGYSIVFKLQNGSRRLFEYSDLMEAEYNPDLGGIVLEGIGKLVSMIGTNLIVLFDLIADHQLDEVTERHEPPHLEGTVAKQGEPYIRELIWERLTGQFVNEFGKR